MTQLLEQRRADAAARLDMLRTKLSDAESLLGGNACLYVTGSFGRGEASPSSDLDVFLVGLSSTDDPPRRLFSHLSEIRIFARLIDAAEEAKFPDFSNDGEYLRHHSVHHLIKSLGRPDDDYANALTARLLLLLESKPLLGKTVWEHAIREVIAEYWRDFKGNETNFRPSFLANDILRLWRTFCVNYEARTSTVPDAKRFKRRAKNYKLKHSRLLTCYSALLHLMAQHSEKGTVTPDDAFAMVGMTPTERIENLLSRDAHQKAHSALRELLDQYEAFLAESSIPEQELVERLKDADAKKRLFALADKFGVAVFNAIDQLGQRSAFHRLIAV